MLCTLIFFLLATYISGSDITTDRDYVTLEKLKGESSDVRVAATVNRLNVSDPLSVFVANVAVQSSIHSDIVYCFHSDHEYNKLAKRTSSNIEHWMIIIKPTPLIFEAYYSHRGLTCGLSNIYGLHRFYIIPNKGASLSEGASTLHQFSTVVKHYASKQPHVLWVLGTALTISILVLFIIPIVVYRCRRSAKIK